jgi:hypothetical protein
MGAILHNVNGNFLDLIDDRKWDVRIPSEAVDVKMLNRRQVSMAGKTRPNDRNVSGIYPLETFRS